MVLTQILNKKNTAIRYSVALVASFAALVVKLNLHSINPNAVPVFYLALTLSSVYGGRGPGIFSALFISVANLYYFIPPINSFYITSLSGAIEFFVFSAGIVMISVLTSSLYVARERAKRASEEAMEYANQKAHFLANVTHEIRTPINAIIGLSGMLSEYKNLSKEVNEHLREIEDSSETLLSLVDDVLDYSRLDFGKIKLERRPFDLSVELKHCIRMVMKLAESKDITFSSEVSSSVPQVLLGDWLRISQVLINLLSNAVKFTEKGKIKLKVGAHALVDSKIDLTFEVTDSGIGIPRALQGKIFEAFFQKQPSSTTKNRGTGLGLAICKKLVSCMDGSLGVQSEVGSGSTFWFKIPLLVPKDQQVPATVKKIEFLDQSQIGRAPKILVVEDNEISQKITMRSLFRLGYQAEAVSSGGDAVKVCNQVTYAAILMDCHMPEMDGYMATRAIRQKDNCQSLPIIALTAYVSPENRELCKEAGMSDYLTKPLRIQQLSLMLKKWIPLVQTTSEILSEKVPPFNLSWDGSLETYLDRLKVQLGEEGDSVHELIDTFIDQTPIKLLSLRVAAKNNDLKTLSALAHSLRSSTGALGLSKMENLCARIEVESLHQGLQSFMPDHLLDLLSQEFLQARGRLADYGSSRANVNRPSVGTSPSAFTSMSNVGRIMN